MEIMAAVVSIMRLGMMDRRDHIPLDGFEMNSKHRGELEERIKCSIGTPPLSLRIRCDLVPAARDQLRFRRSSIQYTRTLDKHLTLAHLMLSRLRQV